MLVVEKAVDLPSSGLGTFVKYLQVDVLIPLGRHGLDCFPQFLTGKGGLVQRGKMSEKGQIGGHGRPQFKGESASFNGMAGNARFAQLFLDFGYRKIA